MRAYHELIDTLYDLLIADEDVSTVTKGDIIDINKKNEFNLAHINVINSSFNGNVISFQVSVSVMALRDLVKETAKDKWTENDNENDNLNDTLYVLHRLYLNLSKLNDTLFLTSAESPEPFTEAGNNVVDGWLLRFNVDYIETESGVC